jgi:hypothetical protein
MYKLEENGKKWSFPNKKIRDVVQFTRPDENFSSINGCKYTDLNTDNKFDPPYTGHLATPLLYIGYTPGLGHQLCRQ